MNPQKIALVSDWFLPRTGGVERHLVELARALSARGRQVEIVTATPGTEVVPELPGVPIVRLDVPLLPGWHTVFRPRDGAALVGLFAERGYDLIHAHSIYSPLALAAAHAGRTLRIPTVLTAHSLVRYACIPVFRALDYRLMWSSWPQVITAVSEAVAADLRRASFAAEVQVLPNGLSLPPRVSRPTRAPDAPVRIVCVGRLARRKRPLALLRTFARLGDKLGQRAASRCRLVIVGGGPLYDEMLALAGELGVADRVEMRGWCTPEEVTAALAGADICAVPASKEAFGLAGLEAAAAGLPVVTLRGSGAAELFTPGVDGLVATDDRGMTDALARLASDPALRTRLGERARVLAERYAWSGVLDRTLQLYRLAAQRLGDRTGAALAPPLGAAAAGAAARAWERVMRACFTVDMEPDCPPYLSGWRGIDEGAPELFALLRRWSIPATLFVTGALVRRDPDRVRAWADEGHEIGCHGDAHVRFSTIAPDAAFDDLRRATDTLQQFGPVRSFRAPNLDLPRAMLPRLGELGYALDSSEGRHKHLRARVRREAGLLRVPASTTSSILRLPPWLVAPLLRLLPSPLVLFIHPWELVDLGREKLRFDCRAGTGPPALAALDGLFARLKEAGYRFERMDALLSSS